MSPPTRSIVWLISRAERESDPLNKRSSRKWLTPDSCSGSSRAPTPTQAPAEIDSAPGIRSVATVRPLGRVVIRRSVILQLYGGDRPLPVHETTLMHSPVEDQPMHQ